MPITRSNQISPTGNIKSKSNDKINQTNKKNQSQTVSSQSKSKSTDGVTPKQQLESKFQLQLSDFEARLQIVENNKCKCNCSTEISQRLEKIEEIILKRMPMVTEKIYKYVDEEISERLCTVDQTLNSLANLENSFESHHSRAKRLNDVEKKIRDIQGSIETCEALFDVNTAHNVEIQRQLFETIHRLDNSLAQNENVCDYNNVDHMANKKDDYDKQNTRNERNIKSKIKTNKFVSPIMKMRRFMTPYERYAYTKQFTIQIKGAKIRDSQQFSADFKIEFEKILGRNLVNKIITRLDDKNPIGQINIDILLHVPLSYEYIDNFRFPENWSFFVYAKSKQKHIARRRTNSI